MTQIYKIGTATVTNGSTTVAGTDTGWAVAGVVGGLFTRNGLSVPIESVTDDDTLVLALPWPVSTSTGAYTILRENSAAASVVDLYDRLRQATITLSLHSIHPDFVGTLTEIEAWATGLAPEDTEKVAARLEEGQPDEYYRWGGTELIGPFPIQGGDGDPGPPGEPGLAGEGFNPRGVWLIGETYETNDFVSSGTRSFVSLQDGNIGNEPPDADDDDAFWMFVPSAVGAPGDDGREVELQVTGTHIQWRYEGEVSWANLIALSALEGDPGTPGTPGAAATIAVGAVTTVAFGEEATVNNSGTSSAAVFDFEIPAGEQGDQGLQGDQGDTGQKGWSPVLALVSDGSRRVVQVADWVGGEGSKPATGDYVGVSGLTSVIGDAVDVRGPSGAGSGDVTTSGSVTSQRVARFADATGDVIEDAGFTIAGLLSADNHTDGTTNKVFTATEKTKVGHISVTQAVNLDTIETDAAASKVKTDFISVTQSVDLDAIEARVNALDAVVILKGTWAANAGTFPGSGTAQAGESWIVSTGGTVNSVEFTAGDRIIAITDNASTSTYASNWFKADYTDSVQSVDGAVGAVTVGAIIAAAAAKATPVDADMMVIADSAASNATKKVTWANVKATLKTYFDTLYAAVSHTHTVSQLSDATANARSFLQAANYAAMKTLLSLVQADISGLTTASSPQFTGIELGHASDTTLARSAAGVVTVEGKRIADLATENQPLTGGATVTSKSLGTITTGTLTLDMGDCPLQDYTANGAHTLAPGSVTGACLVDVVNGASAGARTLSGWTKVEGSFTNTNGHKFRCHCSVGPQGSLLIIQALQ